MSLPIYGCNQRAQNIFDEIQRNIKNNHINLSNKINKLVQSHIVSDSFNPEIITRIGLHERKIVKSTCLEITYWIIIRFMPFASVNQCEIAVWPELRQYSDNLHRQWKSVDHQIFDFMHQPNINHCLSVIHRWITEDLCSGPDFESSMKSYDQVLFLPNQTVRQIVTSNRTILQEEFKDYNELVASFFVRDIVQRQDKRSVLAYLSNKWNLGQTPPLDNRDQTDSFIDLSSIFHSLFP